MKVVLCLVVLAACAALIEGGKSKCKCSGPKLISANSACKKETKDGDKSKCLHCILKKTGEASLKAALNNCQEELGGLPDNFKTVIDCLKSKCGSNCKKGSCDKGYSDACVCVENEDMIC